MTYEEQFERAEKEKQVRELSYEIIKWEEEGQEVIGEVIGFETFESGNYETDCLVWKLQTDEGLVSCVLGGVADKRMMDVSTGDLLQILYRGKKELKEGRRVNIFNIKHVRQA